MQEIPLSAIPNQRIRVTLDGDDWEFTLKAARDVMCCDIKCNDRVLLQGLRAMLNQSLIPYRYLSSKSNFAFITNNDVLPWWEQFNQSQYLVWWREDD
ncbi:phage baseplate plug family protein [Providencia sp. SRMPRO-001]